MIKRSAIFYHYFYLIWLTIYESDIHVHYTCMACNAITGILLYLELFLQAYTCRVWQNFECCWITYMLTLAIRGLALSTTRIILMLKMQWLKYLRTMQNKNTMHIYIFILGSFIQGILDKIYLLEDWWLSFVQAVCRFLFPMVSSLYASSAFCTQISFNPEINTTDHNIQKTNFKNIPEKLEL